MKYRYLVVMVLVFLITIFIPSNEGLIASDEEWVKDNAYQPDCVCQQLVVLLIKIKHPYKKNTVRYEAIKIRTTTSQSNLECSQFFRQLHIGLIEAFIEDKQIFTPLNIQNYKITRHHEVVLFIEERYEGLVLKYNLSTYRGNKRGVKYRGGNKDHEYRRYFNSVLKELKLRIL